MQDYRREKIVIVGLGITGLSCINFFLRKGIAPKVMDTRNNPPELNHAPNNLSYHLGSLNMKWLIEATMIISSPGIPLKSLIDNPTIEKKIISDIEIFLREKGNIPVIGITGSNGKSTVTQIVNEIFLEAGIKVGMGGNIGIPALNLLNKNYQLYILELSSFQLEITYSLKFKTAIILNISQDHLDRYPYGIKQYRDVKFKIYKDSENCIFNENDQFNLYKKFNKEYISFRKNKVNYRILKKSLWFAVNNKLIFNCMNMVNKNYINCINSLAALAISDTFMISRSISLNVIKNFKGLPHRFELVYKKNNIKWINDSKSTNIDSTIYALKNITISGTVHLLIGGDSKKADFNLLKNILYKMKIKLYCFGKDGKKIASIFPDISIFVCTLENAMQIIFNNVKSGDVVLLSPACSSTDQFKNFEERGEIFTKLAKYY